MDQPSAAPPALRYDGRIGEIYRIFLLNILFTILTLGIYRFWGMTNYRRYFWSRTSFQGARFEYSGTGGELFVGFLLAGLMLLGMLGAAVLVAFLLPEALAAIPLFLAYLAIIVLAAGAVFAAQRYRLSRTVWCGIRGGMRGSALSYGVQVVLYSLLAGITLLQMVPWVQMRLAERRINASSFGTAPFRFQGRASRLYGPFVLTLLGMAVLLAVVAGVLIKIMLTVAPDLLYGGFNLDPERVLVLMQRLFWVALAEIVAFAVISALVGAWYQCLVARHILGNTTLGGTLRFGSSITPGALLGLIIGNLLIVMFTLGLGLPVVLHRNAAFLAETVRVSGGIDPALLGQTALRASPFGEGMFQQLDTSGVF